MLEKHMGSYYGVALLILRLCIGIVFVAHGSQKLLGMFGGGGIEGTIESFESMGIFYPTLNAWFVALVEFFGGAALILGWFTRECSFLLAAVMAGAIYFVHGQNGFFLQNSGFEYNLVLMGGCITLFLVGSGGIGVDRVMFPRSRWRFVKDPSSVKLEPPSDPPVF